MPSLVWRAAEQTPKVCYRICETQHPITSEDFKPKVVRLPKASRIILRFDPLCQVETGDFVKVYAGDKEISSKLVWRGSRHDVAKSGWPGVDAPGLVINSDSFRISLERVMAFRSDGDTAYGFRVTAEAELSPEAVASMQKAVASVPSEAKPSNFVCASILSEARQIEEICLVRMCSFMFLLSHYVYLQPSACRRPPARARIGRQLNDTIPCSIILVGALEVHIWLGEFVDVYFKVV